MDKNKIPILEEYVSFQGEGINLGVPYYFIRVGGCPLRCNFCDTEYSWTPKADSIVDVEIVIAKAKNVCLDSGIEWVSITGGEPLLYPEQCVRIMAELDLVGIKTHIETSGRFFDETVLHRSALYSADCKTPCTGEVMDGYVEGIDHLRPQDQVKCLIRDDKDMDYAWECNQLIGGRHAMVLQPFNMNIPTESVGNMPDDMVVDVPLEIPSLERIRRDLMAGYVVLFGKLMQRKAAGQVWREVMVSPQLHVFAFGNEKCK